MTIKLASIAYSEEVPGMNGWILEKSDFGSINLLVGKNASGKSRVISVLQSLSLLLLDRVRPLFASADYNAVFTEDSSNLHLELRISRQRVVYEQLRRADKVLVSRDETGRGEIWSEKLGVSLEFQIDHGQLACVAKRDAIQHPFLDPLHNWAKSLRNVPFGTDLGRNMIFNRSTAGDATAIGLTTEPYNGEDPNQVTKTFAVGYETYGEEFVNSILRDMEAIGYQSDSLKVGENPQLFSPPIGAAFFLNLQEADLKLPTWQIYMSTGMFRALALLIQLNYSVFSKIANCVLIDDIGEGLDFSRSTALIKLVCDKARSNSFQLIMSTNDRFIMNVVDLEAWRVVHRVGSKVHLIDSRNNPRVFEDFKFLGMSNFDFFATQSYLPQEATYEENSDLL